MSWTKTHELKVATGTYIDREGKEKKRYETVGHVLSDGGREMYMLKRTFNPAGMPDDGRDTILISKFEVSQERAESAPASAPKAAPANFDDEIPF